MKTFKLLLIAMAGFLMITACQKELSQESGLTGGLATGTLKDSLGDCQPISINGEYVIDSVLNASHYVYVQVEVTAPGIYQISTGMENGFMFSDSGYFSAAGPQTVKLQAVGSPILPIATPFIVNFGTSECSFIVNVVDSAGGGGGTIGAATFTFDNATGVCANPTVQGTYEVGTPLNNTNRVTLHVNVTTPGSYNVTTVPNNGMTFSGTGVLTATGPATITLTGTGTPATGGASTIIVNNGTSGCGFEVTVNSSVPSAVFTLSGNGGPCTGSSVQGTYTSGTALSASNTITVQVNVTTAGAYNINGASANGMTFAASGTFTNTGVQTVTLQGSGTPGSAGNIPVGIAAGTQACTVMVTVNQGSGTGGPTAADSAWSFRQGTRFFFGPIDTAYTETTAGFTRLTLEGITYGTDSLLTLDIIFNGTTIAPGNYTTSTGAIFDFTNASGVVIFEADPSTSATASLNIVIASYNATTRVVTGTFSGTVVNASGTAVPVTEGKFTAVVN